MLAALALLLPALLVPAAPAQAAATCQAVRATIVGTPGADVLHGTPGRDVIAGLGGDDVLRGLGGSDLLCGGSGADRLYGGDDRHWHDQFQTIGTGDRLDGGAGDDLLHPGPRIRGVELIEPDLLVFASADGVTVDLGARTATGQGADRIVWRSTLGVVGSPGDDTVIGTDSPDRFTGKAGDDVLVGLGGRDLIYADAGDDEVRGGSGPDEITSTGGSDSLSGGGSDDVLSVRGGGADRIDAGAGGDLLFLYPRKLSSLDGAVIDGGPPGVESWDTNALYVTTIDPLRGVHFTLDLLAATIAADGHAGALPNWTEVDFSVPGARLDFRGSAGSDQLTTEGNARVDADGRGGNDILYGGPRNDRLVGGDGRDFVSGAGGTDTCDAERERGCEA